jgi:hypothetical protein
VCTGCAASPAITGSHHKKRSNPGPTGPAPRANLPAVVDEHGVVRVSADPTLTLDRADVEEAVTGVLTRAQGIADDRRTRARRARPPGLY